MAGLAQAVGGGRRQARRARDPVDGELDRDGRRADGRDGDVRASRADQSVPDAVRAQEAARRLSRRARSSATSCPRRRQRALRRSSTFRRGSRSGPGGTTLDAWKSDESLALDRSRLPKLDDFALLIFTGGSTGVPKGVNHTHRGLLYSVLQHVTVWPCKFGEERFLNVAPMFHIWGLGYSTLGADLYAQHARHGAALRRRQSRARALRSQDHGVRRRPRADLHGIARRARCSRRPISRSCVIARRAARRAPRSCIANGSRRPASRSSKVGA